MSRKSEFVLRLLRWVAHKKQLIQCSPYRATLEKRNALRFVEGLFRPIKRGDLPLYAVADLLLLGEKQMRQILPSTYNNSYESQLQSLDEMLAEARSIRAAHRESQLGVVVPTNQKPNP